MATHHAEAGEVVDLATWANDLRVEKSKVIKKTTGLELARLVIEAGADMHPADYCSVDGAVVIHCIEGEIIVKTLAAEKSVKQGQLVYLDGDTEHALAGVMKSVVLLTIVLPQN
jgi:quercetin dioxygenase-like cupin family protein